MFPCKWWKKITPLCTFSSQQNRTCPLIEPHSFHALCNSSFRKESPVLLPLPVQCQHADVTPIKQFVFSPVPGSNFRQSADLQSSHLFLSTSVEPQPEVVFFFLLRFPGLLLRHQVFTNHSSASTHLRNEKAGPLCYLQVLSESLKLREQLLTPKTIPDSAFTPLFSCLCIYFFPSFFAI